MNASVRTAPPTFWSALIAGFNLVAGKAYLLLLPIGLDLVLWLGPHFRVKDLFGPAFESAFNLPFSTISKTEMLVTSYNLAHFNLLGLLSTLPVGLPSLMNGIFPLSLVGAVPRGESGLRSGVLPIATPFGQPLMLEMQSIGQALLVWLACILIGLVLGSLYYDAVARATAPQAERFSLRRVLWLSGQSLFFSLFVVLVLLVLAIPIYALAAILALISPVAAQILVMFSLFILLWIFFQLSFTPQGIFAAGQNLFRAMLTSLRFMRALSPGSGLFILSALIIAQGLGMLWVMAPETSWLALAGIFGNAFIGTALLAASFIYYRGGASWAAQYRK